MQAERCAPASVAHGGDAPKGFSRALVDAFPLSLSVFTYGMVYGALARGANHLSLIQTLAMSAFVFAGASQYIILALWHQNAALWTIVGSTFLINARQILYGLTLGQSLKHVRKRHLAWLAHGLTDESYSVAAVEAEHNRVRVAYFAGAGAAVFAPWLLSSAVGFGLGGLIGNPARFGLDFAYTGTFLGLLAAQMKQRRHVAAALLSAATSTLAYHWFRTSGAVFAGALSAFLVGVYNK